MSDSHVIVPFVGVDRARFGMTPEELHQVASLPHGIRRNEILGRTNERRGATEHVFRDGVLSEIVVYKPGRGKAIREQLDGAPYVPVYYDGIDVLDKNGFATLCEQERTREGQGRTDVLFSDLGLLVTGFLKRVPEGAYATVFARERLPHFETRLDV